MVTADSASITALTTNVNSLDAFISPTVASVSASVLLADAVVGRVDANTAEVSAQGIEGAVSELELDENAVILDYYTANDAPITWSALNSGVTPFAEFCIKDGNIFEFFFKLVVPQDMGSKVNEVKLVSPSGVVAQSINDVDTNEIMFSLFYKGQGTPGMDDTF